MTTRYDCAEVEALAGAIALGEAGAEERDAYRAHIAGCQRCLSDFGGEPEIERVMAIPAQAGEAERWTPDLRAARGRRRDYAWKWVALFAAVVLVIFGVRATEKPATVAGVTPAVSSFAAQEARAIAVLNTQTAPRREHQAESLTVGGSLSSARNAGLLGTMAFEVSLDRHATPARCTVTKSSGYRALDQAVCRAALQTVQARQH
jgi:hypothetical protein